MSPAKLDTRYPLDFRSQSPVNTLVRHIAPPKPQLRCPECHSILYTRRNKLCAVCGEALPEAVLFSAEEASRVEEIMRAEREKHRLWMNKG